MANNYFITAKKLQHAINNTFNLRLLINTNQWYSEKKDCPINMYTVKIVTDNTKGNRTTAELFKTYSAVQLTLFLRDYWYELNGWEIPTDNPKWEELKKKYGKTKEASDVEPQVGEEKPKNNRRFSFISD